MSAIYELVILLAILATIVESKGEHFILNTYLLINQSNDLNILLQFLLFFLLLFVLCYKFYWYFAFVLIVERN